MGADNVYRITQLFISSHVLDEVEFVAWPVIEGMDFDFFKTVGVESCPERFGKIIANPFFITAAEGIKLQTVHVPQPLKPFHTIVRCVLRPELPVANPARRTPRGAVEREVWITFFSRLQNPPRIAARVVEVVTRAHVAGHGALRRIAVAGNLHEQRADRRAELGLENQIENLAALRLGIILEQHRSRAATVDHTNAVKAPAPGIAREFHN